MSKRKNIHIVGGDDAKGALKDPELIELTNRANKIERSPQVGRLRHLIAERIFDVFSENRLTRAVVQGIDLNIGPIKGIPGIDPAFYPIEHMKGLRDSDQVVVAKEGNETVGMAGFERRGEFEGRNVYEIRRMAVRKEHEGRFISLHLYKAIMEKLLAKDANALVLVDAQNPVVSKQCKRMGYASLPALEGLTIKLGKERAKQWVAEYEKEGGQFFLYDPLKPKADAAAAKPSFKN